MTLSSATILWCVVQVSCFLCLAAPVYLAVRRRNPRAGTLTAASSLAIVIALSTLAASPWPQWSLSGLETGAADGGAESLKQPAPRPSEAPNSATADAATGGPPTGPAAADAPLLAGLLRALQAAANAPSAEPADAPRRWWPTVVLIGLAGGMTISLFRLIAGLVAVRRMVGRSRPVDDVAAARQLDSMRRNLGIRVEVQLRQSAEVVTPATVGWRRPVVLLPPAWRGWSDVERHAVLAHELAHVAEHDFAAWLVARAAIVIHFYHPLVRWFARRLQLDQELAADATAVQLLGDRQSYLRALANLALATPAHRLAGPARTFIPSRSLLLRRVEMLRTAHIAQDPSFLRSRLARWGSLAVLVAIAVGAAGLRQPGLSSAVADEPEQAAATPAATPYDFAYLPDDFVFFFAIRPHQFAASPRLKPLADLLDDVSRPRVPSALLEQITFAIPSPELDERGIMKPGTGSEFTVIRTTQPTDFKPLLEAGYGPLKTQQHNGREFMTWGEVEGTIAFYAANSRTLVSNPKAGLVKVMDDASAAQPPENAQRWAEEAKGPLFAVANVEGLRKMLPRTGVVAGALGPVFDATEHATLSIVDAEPAIVRAKLVLHDAKDAPMVQKTIESALVLARNLISAQRNAPQPQPAPLAGAGAPAAGPKVDGILGLLDRLAKLEVQVTTEGNVVVAEASIVNVAELVAELVPTMQQARGAARQAMTANNLRQLAIAMHNYHDAYKTLPPAVVYGKSRYGALNPTGDDASDVPRSWRVEILPLLEQSELYKQYRLDEPWDSEANRQVLAKMPVIFRSPHDAAGSTNASYFAVTGPGTIFDDKDGTKLKEITDGASNTILLVEAKQQTPWTKPEDVAYEPGGPLPQLGGWRPGGFVAAFADGSTHLIDPDTYFGDPKTQADGVRWWIEKADGKAAPLPGAAAIVPQPTTRRGR